LNLEYISEAFLVYDGFTLLVEFLFCYPNVVEFFHLGEDGSSQPARVLAVSGREHLRLHWRSS